MRINNYIKYLITLILLTGINIYAQTSENLSQAISQAQQGISNLTPSLNLTLLNNITSQSWNFLFNYGLPFLFVFVVFLYLGWELLWKKEGEINRPLLAVFAIIAIFVTYYFNAALIVIATFTGVILLFIWLYKLSHSITGSIIGSIIIIILAYIVLTNGTSIIGFLLSLAFYILLFILFILIFIYAYKLSQSSDIQKLKKIIYNIHTPQDVTNLRNTLKNIVANFNQDVSQMKGDFTNLVNTLQNNYLNQQHPPKNINGLINLLRKIRDNIATFINKYESYKMDLDQIEASINGRYNEPLRSHLLKILEKEGKEKIKNIAVATHQEYLKEYLTLRNNRLQIKNLAISHKNKRTIDKIFNEMENLIHSFRI
jgi:hypothetical protein